MVPPRWCKRAGLPPCLWCAVARSAGAVANSSAQQFFSSGTLHTPMRSHTLFFLAAIVGCASAQNLKPVADRVAAQNTLFEEQYESDLRNFPERATAFGDYRYNDKLADHSLDAIAPAPQDGRGLS